MPAGDDDPRPFDWVGLDVETRFTYVLALADTDADAVQAEFSGSRRRDIRTPQEHDVSGSVEGIEGATAVYGDIDRRYAEQDESFPLSAAFFRGLLEALEDRWRACVARDAAGEYLGGNTALYSNDRATFRQGGARAVRDGFGLNSPLHWRTIQDVHADPPRDTVTGYDLVGADTPRCAGTRRSSEPISSLATPSNSQVSAVRRKARLRIRREVTGRPCAGGGRGASRSPARSRAYRASVEACPLRPIGHEPRQAVDRSTEGRPGRPGCGSRCRWCRRGPSVPLRPGQWSLKRRQGHPAPSVGRPGAWYEYPTDGSLATG